MVTTPHKTMTRMTQNGISTTQAGQEQYETFYSARRGKKISRVMYDYRTHDGDLFYEQYNIMESHIYNLLSYQDFMQIKLSIILLSI